jgi:hypothetical protein
MTPKDLLTYIFLNFMLYILLNVIILHRLTKSFFYIKILSYGLSKHAGRKKTGVFNPC